MDRGSDALKSHMAGCTKLEMRQTRRGWLQEICGCEAQTEFKYFIGSDQVFHSLEESSCCIRLCCRGCHPYTMTVKELNTEAEIVSMERFFRCPMGGCKCCCYQEATFTSNKQELGSMKETCYFCVPSFKVFDHEQNHIYTMHPPTCIGGMCVNCCAEGNPCGRGCCRASIRIYDPDQKDTDGDAPYIGVILKKPKSAMVEIFTDAEAFEVDFPKDATTDQKGILIGTAIFINSLFFEGEQEQGAA